MKTILPITWTKNSETQINIGSTNQQGIVYKFTINNKDLIKAIINAFLSNQNMRIKWSSNPYENSKTQFLCGYVNDFTFHFAPNGNLKLDDFYNNPPNQLIISVILPATGIPSNWPTIRVQWSLIIDGLVP